MVSAQLVGEYIIRIVSASGQFTDEIRLHSTNIGNGGSSEGSIVNSREKWASIALHAKKFGAGGKIQILYNGAAGTTDASDCVFQLPFYNWTTRQVETFGDPDNSAYWDTVLGDVALLATRETLLCEHVIQQGQVYSIGGDVAFMSVENNA